jgi:NADPH-dependent curcumin reductase CurA
VSNFDLIYSSLPSPAAGEVLVRSVYMSLDPSTRDRIRDGYCNGQTLAIGDIMPGRAVALVVESSDPSLRAGDAVEGRLGWQEYAIVRGDELRKIDSRIAPISTALGVLGRPGLTAYFGLLDICDPQPGETVVVSGAAGSVGMLVGQLAKIRGCRAVGVAGPDVQISWLLDELGFDAAFNYTTPAECHATLEALCPAGIDVYFDTVGGPLTDVVLELINSKARVSICGQISQYNLTDPERGPRWLSQLIIRQAKVQGFLVSSYAERFPEALDQLAQWLKNGDLSYREDVAQGIEAAPFAFIAMLQGKNQGRQLVQLSEW